MYTELVLAQIYPIDTRGILRHSVLAYLRKKSKQTHLGLSSSCSLGSDYVNSECIFRINKHKYEFGEMKLVQHGDQAVIHCKVCSEIHEHDHTSLVYVSDGMEVLSMWRE
jgi:hypothetical protein